MATYPRRSIATRNRNTRSSTIIHCRNLIEISFTREGFFRFHIFLYAHPSIAQPIRTPTMNPVILFTISNTAAIAPPPSPCKAAAWRLCLFSLHFPVSEPKPYPHLNQANIFYCFHLTSEILLQCF